MGVYIVQAGENGPVKIGFTADATAGRRLAKMQTDNHERLTMLRWLQRDLDTEAVVQRRYRHLRRRGDWFAFCATMLGDLGIPDAPPPPPPEYSHTLRQYIADEGLTVPAFARALGVSIQAVHRYINRERTPRRAVMERIQMATSGKVQPNDFYAEPAADAA